MTLTSAKKVEFSFNSRLRNSEIISSLTDWHFNFCIFVTFISSSSLMNKMDHFGGSVQVKSMTKALTKGKPEVLKEPGDIVDLESLRFNFWVRPTLNGWILKESAVHLDAKYEICLVTIDTTFEKEETKLEKPVKQIRLTSEDELVFPIANSVVTDINFNGEKSEIVPSNRNRDQSNLFHQLRLNLTNSGLADQNELKIKLKLISRLSISHPYVLDTIVENGVALEPNKPVFRFRTFRFHDQDPNLTGFTTNDSTSAEWNDEGPLKVAVFDLKLVQESSFINKAIAEKTKNAMILADFEAVFDEENEEKQLLCVANYFLNEKFTNPEETIPESRREQIDVHFVIGYEDTELFKDGTEIRKPGDQGCENRIQVSKTKIYRL